VTNTVSTLAGFFKEVYADKVQDLRPDGVRTYNDVPFVAKTKQNGNSYHQPVALTHEHGFTYAAASSGAFSILSPIAAVHKDATVVGSQMLLESRIDLETAARGDSSAKAFGAVSKHIVKNATKSFLKREECRLLYGGDGTTESGVFRFGSQVTDSGTTQVYNVLTASWAPGVMAGLENCLIDIYDDDGSGGVASTKLNATGDVTITKVDFANQRVTVTGVEAELDALASPPTLACYAYFKGAKDAEPEGLITIAQNVGSLFGIDAAVYGLWAGNEYAVGSVALTFDKILKGLDPAVEKGLESDVIVNLNPKTWTNVMSDLAAARAYDDSYSVKKLANGAKAIEFYGQNGLIEVRSHAFIKQGIALAYPKAGCVERLGACSMTFNIPGMADEMIYILPSNAGYGFRVYANEAPFCSRPGECVVWTGIVNS
jgi:hypothetical protein